MRLFFFLIFKNVQNMYPNPSPIMTVQADFNALRLDSDPSPLTVSDLTSYDLVTESDMQQLSLEIEKERYLGCINNFIY